MLCKTAFPDICGVPTSLLDGIWSNPFRACIVHVAVKIVSLPPSIELKSKVNVAVSSEAGSNELKSRGARGIDTSCSNKLPVSP
jgi:hypothetical protein